MIDPSLAAAPWVATAVKPLTIRMHERDNVAVVANNGGLAAGTLLPSGLTLRDAVPQGHKVALVDLAADAPVLRYGIPIGYALKTIPAGSWVNERLLRMPDPRPLDDLPIATVKPAPRLEGAREGGFGVVADFLRNRSDLGPPLAQQPGAELHAPVGEVLHRRLPGQLNEALVQGRARQPDLPAQFVDAPGFGRAFVQQDDRLADIAVAQGAQPARGTRRQCVEIAARGVDEDELAGALQHRGAAGAPLARLRHRLVEQLHGPRPQVAGTQVQLRRQGVDERVEGFHIASHKAAHHHRAGLVGGPGQAGSQHATVVGHRNRLGVVAGDVAPVAPVFRGPQAGGAGDHKRVAARKHHDVAACQAHWWLAIGGGQPSPRAIRW